MQFLHTLTASTKKPPAFKNTLPEQLFELKNDETIFKKSENLRDICS
jgi:hypothetical protein